MAPISSTRTVYWDPIIVFDIDVDSHTFHCRGTTMKGEVCKNPVKLNEDRKNAGDHLRRLRQIPPERIMPKDLLDVAHWLLCKAVHRKYPDQISAKAYGWYEELQFYVTNGVSKHRSVWDAHMRKRQMVDAEIARKTQTQSAQDPISNSLRLTRQLKEALSELSKKETECRQWQLGYQKVEMENEDLKTNNAKLATRKDKVENERHLSAQLHQEQCEAAATETENLKGMLRARDTEIKKLKTRNILKTKMHRRESNVLRTKLILEKRISRRLLAELHQSRRTVEDKNEEIKDITLRHCEQEISHSKKTDELEGQFGKRKAELAETRTMARDSEKKRHQQIASSASKEREFTEELRRLRMKTHVRAFVSQVKLSIQLRRFEEIKADNDALLDQHKSLQKAMSDVATELQAVETITTPLRLRNVKKGICTVFSVQPLRVRAQRLSENSNLSVSPPFKSPMPVD